MTLANKGLKVGLLDADIHGPNLALMFGVTKNKIFSCGEDFILPVKIN
jgi:Mrp family chromosome partitioning ATPase|nr:MAG: hypothetical protein JST_1460 [Candidatus Parcubacteria bacterium]